MMQTFAWSGSGHRKGTQVFYPRFLLDRTQYEVGDSVHLLPEEDGAPFYIARILRAFEESANPVPTERQCIEVRWYERKQNMPPPVSVTMHDREVCELESTDINCVGCIDSKASVIKAGSYEEAAKQLSAADAANDNWYFCRGMFNQDAQRILSYEELEDYGDSLLDREDKKLPRTGHPDAGTDYRSRSGDNLPSEVDFAMEELAYLTKKSNKSKLAPVNESSKPPMKKSGTSRSGKGAKTGRVCMECGATQTPQWRVGPHGRDTLCNACGVRFTRQQKLKQYQKPDKAARVTPPPKAQQQRHVESDLESDEEPEDRPDDRPDRPEDGARAKRQVKDPLSDDMWMKPDMLTKRPRKRGSDVSD